jgi:cell division protease FtsH
MPEFQEAVERVIAGPERRSRIIYEQEKEIVAYHEAGHALVMQMLPEADPVHKISVVSRGMALGYTMPLPEEDQLLYGRNKFRDELAGLLGGRVAEEEVFGDVTTGASNDLERVTSLARKMVTQYGMSDRLGPQTFGEKEELIFLGREIGEQRNYSEEVAEAIDHEVRRLVDEAYSRAREIIRSYRAKLDELAQYLIKNETIDAEQFQAMFAGA